MSNGTYSRAIEAKARSIRELLSARKYSIDYYQREYKWQRKQVSELLDDLIGKFDENHEDSNERSSIEAYGHYFLGSVIISHKGSEKFIIDGQQRLTTLSLLLIFLHQHVSDSDQKVQISNLIFSQKFGKRSFNLDVPERVECMESLYAGEPFTKPPASESVANLVARFGDIQDLFPEQMLGLPLPFFVDWLIENVHLIEITAFSDGDAYTIFETMNDRGLSLTPTDMLKGYLLANIEDGEKRTKASDYWKRQIKKLVSLDKDEDADAIKAWLRSQYAETIRERKRNATPQDFDLIGTEFHRWVREHEDSLKLASSASFFNFIADDFTFFSDVYERLRLASWEIADGIEAVFYNNQNNFTLQYPLCLAPLRLSDEPHKVTQKMAIVSTYLDILIHRRIWNLRAVDYSTMQYAMFNVMKELRGKSAEDVAEILIAKLADEPERFSTTPPFYLHGMNGRQIHRVLARMTDYVETKSGMASRYTEYIQRSGKGAYEIEHIWSNHFGRHKDEFGHPSEFDSYRNRIGDLLLLPKSFNASYGAMTYVNKRPHYNSQNLLARSLGKEAYDHNPGFNAFIAASALPFQAHKDFLKADVDSRQELYTELAKRIWAPERITSLL